VNVNRKGCAGVVFFIIWLVMTLRWIWGIVVGVFKLAVVLLVLAAVLLLILIVLLVYRRLSTSEKPHRDEEGRDT